MWLAWGILRQGFERDTDAAFQDLASELGYIKAISLMLRLVPGALIFGAIPCASFGFMSSSVHQRDAVNPEGRDTFIFVREGNLLLSRFCLLALAGICRGLLWLIENPGRSTIHLHPCVKVLLRPALKPLLVKWCLPHFTHVLLCTPRAMLVLKASYLLRWMGMYGSISAKPQMGLGNACGTEMS